MNNKKVLLSVPPQFMNTLEEFCKVMSFQIISSEQVVDKSRIESWDDIYAHISKKLGPSYESPSEFLDQMCRISIVGTWAFLLKMIVTNNDDMSPEEVAHVTGEFMNHVQDLHPTIYKATMLVAEKLLPLLDENKEQRKQKG